MRANKDQTHQREALENALACLVRIEQVIEVTRLRVDQARRRGLDGLMSPALEEIADVQAAVSAAKRNVHEALRPLVDAARHK
jgi:hypothetical protein